MLELFLVSQVSGIGVEILIWVVGLILLLLSLLFLHKQHKTGKRLEKELLQLGKVKKHNVEYELVLKVMGLCTWHIDVESHTISYDNDYRDGNDCYVPAPGTPLQYLIDAMAEQDRERIQKSLEEICSGEKNDYHEISQVKIAHSDKFYWTEAYATVAKRSPEGLPETVVGTSMRIDARKEMEAALVTARNKAEESDQHEP